MHVFVEPGFPIEYVEDCGQGLGHHPLLAGATVGAEELLGVRALGEEARIDPVGELGLVLRDLGEVLPKQVHIDWSAWGRHRVTLHQMK